MILLKSCTYIYFELSKSSVLPRELPQFMGRMSSN